MANKSKITSRAEKAKETKEKIYESARQLFGKCAIKDITINSIVKLAGVSKGSFYVHFDSKNALIASLISNYVQKLDTIYKTHLESFPADTLASEIFMFMIEKIADVLIESLGYDTLKTLYMLQLTRDVNTEAVWNYNRDLYKIFSHLITKGIEQGEFHSELSVDLLTKHFVMAFRGLVYEWCIRYPDFSLKEQALQHYGILVASIKSK